MSTEGPICIDIKSVLTSRLRGKARFVPSFIFKYLERLIHQDELNELLRNNYPLRGADFCDGVINDLKVNLTLRGTENLPTNGRALFVSNHPLGGLDGVTMISWLTRHYSQPVKFVVNDLLMAIEPLRECFVPINKLGSQSRDTAKNLDAVLATEVPLVIYPAGLVSRLHDDGTIADLKWQKMFINKAIESRRDIIPVHFSGTNSQSFYRIARLRERLGIRFNFEMALLPREVFRARGRNFTLTVGKPISWRSLQGGAKADNEAGEIRQTVYSIPQTYLTTP